MTEPLVSVDMITYNHAPYIAKAIEGVLEQKANFPFELVIGEDCSTDGTREIVFEYQRKHPGLIRVVASEHNLGATANARQTAQACRGKYLAFCEGDDFWHHPGKLQKQVDYLEGHSQCGLVYSSYDVYHPRLNKTIRDFIQYKGWEMPQSPTLTDFIEEKSVLGWGIATCTVMLRRGLYDEVKTADPYLHLSGHFRMGDTQLWAELSVKTQLHYIPESLATHVISEESATRSKDVKKQLQFSVSQAEMMLYLCSKYNVPHHVRAIHERWWCNASLRLAFYRRDMELANEVRTRRKKFSAREWIHYLGAKYVTIHYGYRTAALIGGVFRQKRDHWL
jgi:glycosyltransferase involved in cell wall biosynthesis